MVANKSAENTPNAQIAAKLTAQDQKFGILIKNVSLHWASVVRVLRNKACSICYVNANEMTKMGPFFRNSYYSENTSNHALGTGLAFVDLFSFYLATT